MSFNGTVPSRQQKRRAEDCVEWVSGVTHVQTNLRVDERQEAVSREAARARGESTTGTLG